MRYYQAKQAGKHGSNNIRETINNRYQVLCIEANETAVHLIYFIYKKKTKEVVAFAYMIRSLI